MIHPSQIVRTAIQARLNGNITVADWDAVANVNVPVTDRVDPDIPFPYVYYNQIGYSEISDKQRFAAVVTVVLDVVTGFEGKGGGQWQSDAIVTTILGLIDGEKLLDLQGEGLKNYIIKTGQVQSLQESTDTHYIIRQLMTYEIHVHELSNK